GKAFDAVPADLAACLEIRPGDRATLAFRAQFYMATGKPEMAMPDLDALVATDPDASGAYMMRAQAYELAGNGKKELEDLQAAQSKAPTNKAIAFPLGLAQMELGEFDQAAENFRQSLGVRPGYAWLWLAI